jgi:hypothetical protein
VDKVFAASLAKQLREESTAPGSMSATNLAQAALMLEAAVGDDGDATPKVEVHVGSLDKLKQVQMHQRFMTSWHLNLLNEMVHRCSGPWPDGLTPSGDMNMRMPSVQEIMDRAVQTLDAMMAVAEQRGYVASVPSLVELQEEDTPMGFTRRDT